MRSQLRRTPEGRQNRRRATKPTPAGPLQEQTPPTRPKGQARHPTAPDPQFEPTNDTDPSGVRSTAARCRGAPMRAAPGTRTGSPPATIAKASSPSRAWDAHQAHGGDPPCSASLDTPTADSGPSTRTASSYVSPSTKKALSRSCDACNS